MVGEEGSVVGGQESYPHKQSGRHAEEDVPRLVEIVWELPCEERENGADDNQQEVEGERGEEALLGLMTV